MQDLQCNNSSVSCSNPNQQRLLQPQKPHTAPLSWLCLPCSPSALSSGKPAGFELLPARREQMNLQQPKQPGLTEQRGWGVNNAQGGTGGQGDLGLAHQCHSQQSLHPRAHGAPVE